MTTVLTYTGAPPPARFNIARHCLAYGVATTPGKLALVVFNNADRPWETAERWTYAEFDQAVRRIAGGLLAEGLNPGERLLIRLPNGSDYLLFYLAAIAAGILPVPLSTQLTNPEVEFLLADTDAAAIVEHGQDGPAVDRGRRRVIDGEDIRRLKAAAPIADYADTAAEDPAYISYTSGTTGRPKGVVHAQRTILGRYPMHWYWHQIGPDDAVLHAGAMNWTYTLGVGLLDPLSVGATSMFYGGPKDISMWPRLIQASRATIFVGVPSLFRAVAKYRRPKPGDFPMLRHCLASGEALAPAVLGEWRAATGLDIYESFGMSECSNFISVHPGMPIRPGSAGKAQRGRHLTILPTEGSSKPVSPGEAGLLAIHRSDPGLMLGYWRRPEEEATAFQGDWFIGGDLAAFDKDGYFWHQGRADDLMNPGGHRVSPAEVEAAMADFPGLAEFAVAEFHPRPEVSLIGAYVVRQPGCEVDAEALLAHAAARLAAYKCPRQVFFVDALPRSRNGKLLRRELAGLTPKG